MNMQTSADSICGNTLMTAPPAAKREHVGIEHRFHKDVIETWLAKSGLVEPHVPPQHQTAA